ncbi:MAG: TerC family protein, partial [Actinomycetaceae bacterium]|nr:TerC family protein [Actinomycetaceae bacterium]
DDVDTNGNPVEYEPNAITRWTSRIFKVTQGFVGDRLIARRSSGVAITPLFLCIVSIGSVDLMFALDSIPASFGLTRQPFIIFAANAFALMGLRQMFFLVDALLERLVFLNFGLAAILGFIGLKLLVEAFHSMDMLMSIPVPPALVSLGFVLVILAVTVLASLVKTRREAQGGETN